MSASRYPLPEQRFKVPMSQQALESWVSRFPDYGAPKDAPALRHADRLLGHWVAQEGFVKEGVVNTGLQECVKALADLLHGRAGRCG